MMQKNNGFTLIELMIVVAIVAILTTVAYPSYIDNVRKTKRASVQADLMELASYMERSFTENNVYNSATASDTLTASGITSDDYTLSISTLNATEYILKAAPTGNQSSDRCGIMKLSQTSAKTATVSGVAVTGCW